MSSPPSSDEGGDSPPPTTPPAAEEDNPLAGIPELVTYPTTNADELISALKLIADSVAQQRQIASRSLLYHPLTLSFYIVLLALTSQLLSNDVTLILTTVIGISMAFLAGAQWATVGYLRAAEEIGWKWLGSEQGAGGDLVVVTKFGKEIIGTVVVRLVGTGGKKTAKKALVRGWAVRMRYRGKGVGGHLLDEGVRIAREKLGSQVEVTFAEDHANSRRILPKAFCGPFEKREARARQALEKSMEAPQQQQVGETVVVQSSSAASKAGGRKRV